MGRAAQLPLRTLGQNRRIWGLVTELRELSGLSQGDAEDVLHRCCRECSAQEHTSQLTERQAARVIAMMVAEISGYKKKPASPKRGQPGDCAPGQGPRTEQRITPDQQRVLQALFAQAGLDTQERRMGFCRQQCDTPWPQTQAHADALFEPLKAMILRRVTPEQFQARVKALIGHPKLDQWKTNFVADLQRQIDEAIKAGRPVGKVITPYKLAKLGECEQAAAEEED